jgi:hypothetical protein
VSGKEGVPREQLGQHKYRQETAPGYIKFPKTIREFKYKWKVSTYLSNNIVLLRGTVLVHTKSDQ